MKYGKDNDLLIDKLENYNKGKLLNYRLSAVCGYLFKSIWIRGYGVESFFQVVEK